MDSKNISRKARSYVIEAIVAIVVIYFLLGGSKWSPALWAIFAALAIWIVVMNVRRDAGLESIKAYNRWQLQVAFLMVIGLLVASIWKASLWLFILSLVLGAIWASDLSAYRNINRSKNDLEHRNVGNE
jgi:chromate transport protein ChrA